MGGRTVGLIVGGCVLDVDAQATAPAHAPRAAGAPDPLSSMQLLQLDFWLEVPSVAFAGLREPLDSLALAGPGAAGCDVRASPSARGPSAC